MDFKEIKIESGKNAATAKIYIDGKQATNVTKVSFWAEAGETVSVTLTIVPDRFIFNGEAEVKTQEDERFYDWTPGFSIKLPSDE